ncbi:hypothetical protein RJ43_12040 [Alteromonas macleodii]|nr:hypothetical protein RJ43_12040 [Alteromonas macleodii]
MHFLMTNQRILTLQISYLFLCIGWNVYGLWCIAEGERPLGPTASFEVITLLALIMGSLLICYKKHWSSGYMLMSLLILLLGGYAIVNGLTRDPFLWSSTAAWYSGISINILGVLSFVLQLSLLKKKLNKKPL